MGVFIISAGLPHAISYIDAAASHAAKARRFSRRLLIISA